MGRMEGKRNIAEGASSLEEAKLSVQQLYGLVEKFNTEYEKHGGGTVDEGNNPREFITEGEKRVRKLKERIQKAIDSWKQAHPFEPLPQDFSGTKIQFEELERSWEEKRRRIEDDLKEIENVRGKIFSEEFGGKRSKPTRSEDLDNELELINATNRRGESVEAIFSPGYEEKIFSLSNIDFPSYLTVLNSPRSWKARKNYEKGNTRLEFHPYSLLDSIGGLDNAEAWRIRKHYFENPFRINGHYSSNYLLESLVGLDSDAAWSMRNILYEKRNDSSIEYSGGVRASLRSISGLNSEKAWDMREKIMKDYQYLDNINIQEALAYSLTGLDSERAWGLREKMKLYWEGED